MTKNLFIIFKGILNVILCLAVLPSCIHKDKDSFINNEVQSFPDTLKQKADLEKLLRLMPPDRTVKGRVSYFDATFQDWIKRTGELPPDFDIMPSIPFLPDPLLIDEGKNNIPVKSTAQWKEKREWMKRQLEYYITGTYPSKPDNLKSEILSQKNDGETIIRKVMLSFGPEHKATLTIELMIPPGNGPFPVFLTQWNHREWAQIAVRRGYVGCIYAGSDQKDDTELYSEIWAADFDFSCLMRRSFGASRAIDYLYTLSYIDKNKIGISGHSRNGKQSLMAAAFDERITACIPVSGGTGAEIPWKYCSQNYDIEDIALLAPAKPSWFHPRLRFFIGREDKLPVDQNLFMALIAPRGLMLTTALNEGAGNPWGMEQAYLSARKVYEFLGAENNLAVKTRDGLHGLRPRDIEEYIDFFDYIFKRNDRKPENRLFFDYSFEKWCERSKEKINPQRYPVRNLDDLGIDSNNNKITSVANWINKKTEIKSKLKWALGEEPSGVFNPGPGKFNPGGGGEDNFGSFIIRPEATQSMGKMAVNFGDMVSGYLYYPGDKEGNLREKNIPVLIYLHEYDYSKGFGSNTNTYYPVQSLFQSITDRGYAVFSYDMIGFGNRVEEGTHFYDRYPNWSKMGKMVADVKGAVDILENLDFIDSTKIFVAGYTLGAMVGLYTAALDERIAGVASVAGFTPMRLSTEDKGREGIKTYSHLHGLLPRLGFFVGNEARIPYDFHEILACIAPRPLLVIVPVWDKDADFKDVSYCVDQVRKIYSLFGKSEEIQFFSPDDYNRFSFEMRERTYEWLQNELD